jgi:hypothetical protein
VSNKLTCAQLGAALEAAETAGIYRDGPTMHTLNALVDSLTLHAQRDNDPARVTDGDLPVTVEQVDEAIAELRDPEVSLARRHLKSLKAARDLLAAEVARRAAEQAAEGSGFVTRAEFSAWARAVAFALTDLQDAQDRRGFADGDFRARLRARLANAGVAAIEPLLALLEDIRERDGIASRKRAQSKVRAVSGGAGINY